MDEEAVIANLCARVKSEIDAIATTAGFRVYDGFNCWKAPTGEEFVTIRLGGAKEEGAAGGQLVTDTPEEAVAMLLRDFSQVFPTPGHIYWRALPRIEQASVKVGRKHEPIGWRARMRVLVSREKNNRYATSWRLRKQAQRGSA